MNILLSISAVKALVFDIDKTLTTTQKELTQPTKQVIADLVQQGQYELALCSGRAPALAEEALQLFPDSSYHVLNGGGTIIKGSSQVVWKKKLPSETVRLIATQAEKMGAEFEFEHQGKLYVSERKYARQSHDAFSTKDLDDWSTSLLCVQWINQPVRDLVTKVAGLEVKEMLSEVNGPYLDITPQGVNKATGLQRWTKLTGIDLEKVMGFGDSANDLEFLNVVGHAVAMGNATDEVMREADIVIGHANQDGLARYLREVFL